MLTKELSTAERVQPCFIEPMQVAPVRRLPDSDKWSYEAKLDGYRCLAATRSTGVVLWSRRGNVFTERFPQIARACEKLPRDTLIDGELIVLDENGRCTFNALQHSRPKGHIQLYAFDVLIHGGRNVLRSPIEERRQFTHRNTAQGSVPGNSIHSVRRQAGRSRTGRQGTSVRGCHRQAQGLDLRPGQRSGAWVK